jgi:competence protein ComEA
MTCPDRNSIPLLLLLWLGCFGSFASLSVAQPPANTDEGRRIIESACVICHELSMVTNTVRTNERWVETVSDMVSRGAPLIEGEREAVLSYLTSNFGPESAKIQINRAAPQSLQLTLSLTSGEAEGIVRYREENGEFQSMEDLGMVPGINMPKIEAGRDRIVF